LALGFGYFVSDVSTVVLGDSKQFIWPWAQTARSGVTNLLAIAGHFVSYHWVSGPHNFLVILLNLLKTKQIVHQQKQTTVIKPIRTIQLKLF